MRLSRKTRKSRATFLCCLLLVAMCSCTIRPRGVLSQRKMEKVLYELHKAEGVLQAAGYNTGKDEELSAYYEAVLMQYGVTQAEFDSSVVWYTDNPKQFTIVYGKVVQRLKADRDRAQEESSRIARAFNLERAYQEVRIDTIPTDLVRHKSVLHYILLDKPNDDYTIIEPLDSLQLIINK